MLEKYLHSGSHVEFRLLAHGEEGHGDLVLAQDPDPHVPVQGEEGGAQRDLGSWGRDAAWPRPPSHPAACSVQVLPSLHAHVNPGREGNQSSDPAAPGPVSLAALRDGAQYGGSGSSPPDTAECSCSCAGPRGRAHELLRLSLMF